MPRGGPLHPPPSCRAAICSGQVCSSATGGSAPLYAGPCMSGTGSHATTHGPWNIRGHSNLEAPPEGHSTAETQVRPEPETELTWPQVSSLSAAEQSHRSEPPCITRVAQPCPTLHRSPGTRCPLLLCPQSPSPSHWPRNRCLPPGFSILGQ